MGGTLDSTIELMSEMTKLNTILTTHGNFGELQDELVNRANEVIGEMEKLCLLLKKDCILFDEMSTKFPGEKMELQGELVLVKKERDDLMKELTRLKEDERKASEWAKMLEEKLAGDFEEQTQITKEKIEMISELNVKVTNLNNQVLEKDEMLNKFRERLKTIQKEQELHDLEHQKSQAYQVMEERLKNHVLENDKMLNAFEEKLKLMEVKMVQKEQELHDLKHQKLAAYQISDDEDLKIQVLEKDMMLNACTEKLKIMEMEVAQKIHELRDLKHQKIAAYQIIGKLTDKQTEVNQRAEELRRQNVEASENADKLKQLLLAVERDKLKSVEELKNIKEKQLEADTHLKEVSWKILVALQAVEEFKEWTLALDESFEANKEKWEGLPRIRTKEEGLIRVLKVKVLDLANSVSEPVDVNSPIPKGEGESLRMLTGINEGSGNEDDCFEQAGSQFHSSPPQVVETSGSADIEKGTDKSHCSGIMVAEDTVEVVNRDDEARPGDLEYNLDLLVSLVPIRKRSSLGKTEGKLPNKRRKKEPTREPSQENDECLAIKANTLNPVLRRCKEKAVVATNSQIQIWTSSSDSEDESCSDLHMNNMVRIIRFERLRKTWKSESDMLKDFQKDAELCMDAVCVLYRWKLREPELPHFDAMGGCDMAEYLINGEPACRLWKFVPDVKKERPKGLVLCRKIATDYCEKLFSIYCNGNDPLFRS